MPRKKLYRLQTVKDLSHVLEFAPGLKGAWNTVFHNDHEIVLELGCGRGELSVGLTQLFPDKNFIGIDKKADRLWFGGKASEEQNLENVRFLRLPIEKIDECFTQGEVSEIWVTFPDPFLRRRDEKRRLLSPRFLDLYRKVLKSRALIHLKTDSETFFTYALTLLDKQKIVPEQVIRDIYQHDVIKLDPVFSLQTTYEKQHLAKGKQIFYLQFRMY
ncbi:MAG: tRNA (guanosine(46)-N7)-methyltransferase TrmB [Candidatus Abawacabacteria bacterium RBG_16_42_10]|uniref:tRNA (guanine-N(7)-)-methyltransferase n=1 Tax=Candidatus Abawacabacteria bacterium RBG_16_42_10 TaxID=1817814 RepID=A0A1F4XKQ0_9BACT|nr:MAG: tRNA (guanosine(46)-N7)-methyltransferase TrmB [Candidatus Abawacabacteria bacterium RBG_16_42_10]